MIMLGTNRLQAVRAGDVGIGRAYIGERLIWQTGIPAVWNQLWDNTGANLSKQRATTSVDGDVLIVKKGSGNTIAAAAVELVPGHAYYIVGDFFQDYMAGEPYALVTSTDVAASRAGGFNFQCPKGVWTPLETIYVIKSSGPWLSARIASTAANGSELKLRGMAVIDLTLMFGEGREPTAIDDPVIAKIKAYVQEHPEYNSGNNIVL